MVLIDAAGRAKFDPDKMGKASLAVGAHLYAGLNAFEPGQSHEPHVHADQDKLYVVLQGQGEVTVGAEHARVGPGDLVLAAAGKEHSIRNPGPDRLVVIVVLSPPPKD